MIPTTPATLSATHSTAQVMAGVLGIYGLITAVGSEGCDVAQEGLGVVSNIYSIYIYMVDNISV